MSDDYQHWSSMSLWLAVILLFATGPRQSSAVEGTGGQYFTTVGLNIEVLVDNFSVLPTTAAPYIAAGEGQFTAESLGATSSTLSAVVFHCDFELVMGSSYTPADIATHNTEIQNILFAVFGGAEVVSVVTLAEQSVQPVYGGYGGSSSRTSNVTIHGGVAWQGFANLSSAISMTNMYSGSDALLHAMGQHANSTMLSWFFGNTTQSVLNRALLVEMYVETPRLLSSGFGDNSTLESYINDLHNITELVFNGTVARVSSLVVNLDSGDEQLQGYSEEPYQLDAYLSNECVGATPPNASDPGMPACTSPSPSTACKATAMCLPQVKTTAHAACEALTVVECRAAPTCQLIAKDLAPIATALAGINFTNQSYGLYTRLDLDVALNETLHASVLLDSQVMCVHTDVETCLLRDATTDGCPGSPSNCTLYRGCLQDACPAGDLCCGYSETQCTPDNLPAKADQDCKWNMTAALCLFSGTTAAPPTVSPPPPVLPPSPPPPSRPPPPVPGAGQAISKVAKVRVVFNIDFAEVSSNVTAFAERIRTAFLVSNPSWLPDWVHVDNIRAASVAADITVQAPASRAADLDALVAASASNPQAMFASDNGLSGTVMSSTSVSSTSAGKTKRDNGPMVGGIVGGLGGTLFVGVALALYARMRKRHERQNVLPNYAQEGHSMTDSGFPPVIAAVPHIQSGGYSAVPYGAHNV